METNELNTMLRQIDHLDRTPPVDTLVEKSIRNGRRRLRNRRLTAVGALGATLATASAVLAFGMSSNAGVTIAPAATPTPSQSQTEPEPDSATMPTTAELKKIMKAYVPDDLTMRKVSEGLPGAIDFELGDKDGYSWVAGGVARSSWTGGLSCTEAQGCTKSKIDGGELMIFRDREKVGDGTWYYFERPDGTYVWLGQRNAFDGNGPVTRDKLPLTDKEVIKLITAPEWQKLTDQLPEEAPADEHEPTEAEKNEKLEKKPR